MSLLPNQVFENDANTVALWRFNGGFHDETTNGYDLAGVGVGDTVSGLSGHAVSFNGTDQNLLKSESNFRGSDTVGTIEFWAKRDSAGTSQKVIFNSSNQSSIPHFTLQFLSNKLDLTVRGGAENSVRSTNTITDTDWHYYVVSTDGATWKMYIDGVEEVVDVRVGSNTGDWFGDIAGTSTIAVGAGYYSASPIYYLDGDIDSIRISNIQRTQKEIVDSYNRVIGSIAVRRDYLFEQDVNTVALWRMNGDATDETGVYDLTEVSSPSQVSGIAGTAYSFNGSTQYLERSVANFRSGDSFGTIEVWFKASSGGSIFGSCDEASTSYNCRLALRPDNGYLLVTFKNTGAQQLEVQTDDLRDDQWHYAVVTSNGSSYTCYIDGVEKTLTVVSGSNNGDWFADITNRDNITVGALKRSSLVSYFAGAIDSIRISNIELTAQQVKENFYRGINNPLLYGANT